MLLCSVKTVYVHDVINFLMIMYELLLESKFVVEAGNAKQVLLRKRSNGEILMCGEKYDVPNKVSLLGCAIR